jgi:ubiquinone/menaquinone biosynthesis C-methylase UbiE
MLKQAGVFPGAGGACLEVGFGSLGWLGELASWGLRESDLHGIELDPVRSRKAREILPGADRLGDASQMPWADESFELVVASAVFTPILDFGVRQIVAREITRVLAPGGALLWYDFAVNLRALFPDLRGNIPPRARWVVPRSWLAATLPETLAPLRTHLVAVLVKRS